MELIGYMEYNPDESYKQSKAIVKGVIRGVKDLVEIVSHPIDNIVLPVSELVYDATIITLHHQYSKSREGPYLYYKSMLEKNPQLHYDSSKRMQKRINGAKSAIKDFVSLSIEAQIESITAVGTTILIPGALVKGTKYIQNVRKFGTGNPPQFHSIGDTNLGTPIKTYTVEDIRGLKSINDMIYVYTADNELLISKTFHTKTFGGQSMQILHPELAKLKPVYAAGEVIVNEGKIIELTNFSGHYQPAGTHLGTTIKNAFNKAGYGEVEISTYTEFVEYGAKTIATKKPLPGKGANVATAGIIASNEDNHDVDYPDHLKEYFEEKEEYARMMKELPGKTADAKQAYQELVKCAQEEFSADEKPEVNITAKLLKIAGPIHEFGLLGQNISQLAILTGGHKRTWNGVAKVSQGSLSIAASLTSIGSAESMLSLGAITGGIGLAIGVMGMIGGLFGDNGDDDNGIGEALQQIHQSMIDMHNAMLECFHRVEEVLIVCVVEKLNQINTRLSRLERITVHSFKELHTKDLIDITDALKKEVVGEHKLTNSEKRSYLRQLSCWIDNHSKSSLQTQTLRHGGDISKVIEVLEETNLMESLPLFLGELINIVPVLNIPNINQLPNIEILSTACDVYMIVSRRPGYFNNTETIKRAKQVFNGINDINKTLTDFKICNESLIDILTRQYDNYRFWVGQFICKIHGDANWANIETSLLSILKEGSDKSSLLEMIHEMELRRLCLLKLGMLLNVSVPQLESKRDILERLAKCYVSNKVYDVHPAVLKRSIEMGANPSAYDSWGRPIHYLTKCTGTAREIHMVFKTHPVVPVEMGGGTRYDQGDTWGSGSNPLLHAMNRGRFPMGVLFCANGLDISEADGRCGGSIPFNNTHMGNAYWWRDVGAVSSIIGTRLVRLMNTAGNPLYRDHLRGAYKYYKLVEAGNLPVEEPTFTLDSLLLLTCVIGDLFPLRYYLRTKTIEVEFLNQSIEGLGITFVQFAKACNQPAVTSYLLSLGGNLDIPTLVDVKSVYDEKMQIVMPLIWQLQSESNIALAQLMPPVGMGTFIDDLNGINLKIDTYLKLSINIESKPIINDDYLVFRDLISEVINTVPINNKFYNPIKKNFIALNKAIETGDVKCICNSFNTLNSILNMITDLPTPYTIYPGVLNLISDIKSTLHLCRVE